MDNKKPLQKIGAALKVAWTAVKDFFRKDTWMKVISLLFAILLWSYVIADENPSRQMTLREVPVSYTGITALTEQGLTVDLDGLIHETDIKILAGQDSHKNINQNSVKAFVDFSHISEAGTYEMDIQATVSVGGASVRTLTPGEVQVVVEEIAERRIPVSCETTGAPAEGFYVNPPQPEDPYILITGPKSQVEKVTRAVAVISVEDIAEDSVNSYAVKLLDINGKQVKLGSVSERIPSVIVELQVMHVKKMTLEKEIILTEITDIKEGFEVVDVTLNAAQVELVGEAEVLDAVEVLRIKPVSAEQADHSKILVAELQPMEGVEYLTGNTVSFYAQIEEKRMTKQFENVAIGYINAQEGYQVSMSVQHTGITLTGGISSVTGVTREQLKVYVDLAGQKPGTYVLPVKMEDLPGIDSADVTIGNATVTVVIE